MTLDEMILEVFDNLGRPTDVSPLDELDDNSTINPSLQGYRQLRNWVNQGYKAITTWRTPNGRFYRQRDMIDRKYVQWGPHELTSHNTDTTDTSEQGYDSTQHEFSFPGDDYYVGNRPPAMVLLGLSNLGDLLEYEEVAETVELQAVDPTLEYYRTYRQEIDADWVCLAYFIDDHTIYTIEPLPWVIPETVATIYERGINWGRFNVDQDLNDLYAIRQLRIINTKDDMDVAARTENFTQNLAELGTPSEYWREADYLYFDRHVVETQTYQIEYYKQAEALVNGSDTPAIPERYHTPIVYWASQRGLLRYGENNDAYSMRGFLDMEMRSIIKEEDLDVERYESNFRSGFTGVGYGR